LVREREEVRVAICRQVDYATNPIADRTELNRVDNTDRIFLHYQLAEAGQTNGT